MLFQQNFDLQYNIRNLMRGYLLAIIASFSLLTFMAQCLMQSPTYQTSTLIMCGIVVFQNPQQWQWPSIILNSTKLPKRTPIGTSIGYDMDIANNDVKVFIRDRSSPTTSSVQIQVEVHDAQNFNSISFTYLAIDPSLSLYIFAQTYDDNNHYTVPVDEDDTPSSGSFTLKSSYVYLSFMKGFVIRSPDQTSYDLKSFVSFNDASSYYVRFTSDLPDQIRDIQLSIVIMDLASLTQDTNHIADYGSQAGSGSGFTVTSSRVITIDSFFMGISGFSVITNVNNLNFDADLDLPEFNASSTVKTVQISSSLSFSDLKYNYINFKELRCPEDSPYNHTVNRITKCYDICPDSNYANSSTNLCQDCSIAIEGCYLCSPDGATCQECDRYYSLESSNTTCTLQCLASFCVTCVSGEVFICEDCEDNFTLVSGRCMATCGDGLVAAGVENCDDGNDDSLDGCSSSCSIEEGYECEPTDSVSACYLTEQISIELQYIEKEDFENKVNFHFSLHPVDMFNWDLVSLNSLFSIHSPTSGIVSQTVTIVGSELILQIEYDESLQNQELVIKLNTTSAGSPILERQASSSFSSEISADDNQGIYVYEESVYGLASIMQTIAIAVGALAFCSLLIGYFKGKMIGVESLAVVQSAFFGLIAFSYMNPCFKALTYLWPSTGYNIKEESSYLLDQNLIDEPKGLCLSSLFLENYNLTAILIFLPLLLGLITLIILKKAKHEKQQNYEVKRKNFNEEMTKRASEEEQLSNKKQQECEQSKQQCNSERSTKTLKRGGDNKDNKNEKKNQFDEMYDRNEKQRKKIKKITYFKDRFFGQYTFTGLMASAYLINTAFGIEMVYGIKNSENSLWMASLIFGFIFFAMFIPYFILLCRRSKMFGEYYRQFFKQKFIQQNYYCLIIVQRVVLGLSWGFGAGRFKLLPIIPMLVYLFFFIILIVFKPYAQPFLNNRAIFNMAVCFTIQLLYLVSNLVPTEDLHTKPIFFYIPMVILILLLITVILNLVILVYYLIGKARRMLVKENVLESNKKFIEMSKQSEKMMKEMRDTRPVIRQLIASHQWHVLADIDKVEKMKIAKIMDESHINQIYNQI